MEVSKPEEKIKTRDCLMHGAYPVRSLTLMGKTIVQDNGECPVCVAKNLDSDQKKSAEYARIREKRRAAEAITELHKKSGAPFRYCGESLENFEANTDAKKAVLMRVTEYCRDFLETLLDGRCMILVGTPGTGKTHLACAAMREVIEQGNSARYTTVSDFSRAIRATFSRKAEKTDGEVLDEYVDQCFLVIDEVGSSSGSDHEKQALFDLINRRYNSVRPTMILSNLSALELSEYLGDRIMDRLRQGGGKLLVLNWESHRK
jgi:DNA replication protein DnaC